MVDRIVVAVVSIIYTKNRNKKNLNNTIRNTETIQEKHARMDVHVCVYVELQP